MATGSSEFQIGVKMLADSTSLTQEASTAETAIDSLEASVKSSTDAMETEFNTVSTSATSALDDTSSSIINTSGKKLKSAGKAVGGDFALALTQGVTSGDIAGTVTGIFSSLALVGGAAAVGVGIAGSLISGMVTAANEKRQAFIDAVDEGFAQLEVKAGQSGHRIMTELIEAISFSDALDELGGDGGSVEGLHLVQDATDEIGRSQAAIFDLIREGINPSTRETYHLLKQQLNAWQEQRITAGGLNEEQSEIEGGLKKIYDLAVKRTGVLREDKALGEAEVDWLDRAADKTIILSGAAADHADNVERSAAAIDRIAARISQISQTRIPDLSQLSGF